MCLEFTVALTLSPTTKAWRTSTDHHSLICIKQQPQTSTRDVNVFSTFFMFSKSLAELQRSSKHIYPPFLGSKRVRVGGEACYLIALSVKTEMWDSPLAMNDLEGVISPFYGYCFRPSLLP